MKVFVIQEQEFTEEQMDREKQKVDQNSSGSSFSDENPSTGNPVLPETRSLLSHSTSAFVDPIPDTLP